MLLGIVLVWVVSTLSVARGNITFTLSPASDGGVKVVGTGSGNVTGITNTFHFDLNDFNADFLSDSLGTTPYLALATSGTLRNNTTGVSASMYAFLLGRDLDSTDNVAFETNRSQPNVTFNGGDSFTFSVAAAFAPGYIKFSDLKVGSYSDTVKNTSTEIFGSVFVNVVVPEPPYSGIVPAGLLMLLIAARAISGRRARLED
jgi:hypothetical protein